MGQGECQPFLVVPAELQACGDRLLFLPICLPSVSLLSVTSPSPFVKLPLLPCFGYSHGAQPSRDPSRLVRVSSTGAGASACPASDSGRGRGWSPWQDGSALTGLPQGP